MTKKYKSKKFKKIGENNAKGHIIEVEKPGSDFLIRYPERVDIALGDSIEIITDPEKGVVGTVIEIGPFCETGFTPPAMAPFQVKVGDKIINLVVINT